MHLIYKYIHEGLLYQKTSSFRIPKRSRFLCVDNQYDKLTFWFEVDENDKEMVDFIYTIVETEKPAPYNLKHLGTVLFFEGSYVIHIFQMDNEVIIKNE